MVWLHQTILSGSLKCTGDSDHFQEPEINHGIGYVTKQKKGNLQFVPSNNRNQYRLQFCTANLFPINPEVTGNGK